MSGFTKNVRAIKCPKDETIDDYLLNRLNKKKEREVDLHLFECFLCLKRVLDKQDLIKGVKIVFKNKSDAFEKEMKKTMRRIVDGKKIERALKKAGSSIFE